MKDIIEQYRDVEVRSVLEVLAGDDVFELAPGDPTRVASLVVFPKKKGAAKAEMGARPSTEYLFVEDFARDNPTLDAERLVNVQLNRAQAIELACTLLHAAGVEYELYGDIEDPADDIFRSY